jgi:hypothetical protein
MLIQGKTREVQLLPWKCRSNVTIVDNPAPPKLIHCVYCHIGLTSLENQALPHIRIKSDISEHP